jgi:Cu(I)/Ag(I) efflux system membrane fusion protein
MQERDNRLHRPPTENGQPDRPPVTGARHGFWWKAWQVLKVVQARLRFVAILAVIGLLIGYWDTLNGYYEKWTRPLYGHDEAAAGDVEYFCPMHPFIVRDDRKEKCPICHMDLAKRKKGTGKPEPLAPGTVSRVQLSPYRIVLAGVQTSAVQYLHLVREITTFGSVEFNETKEAHIATRQKGRIVKLFANYTGQMVEEGEKLAVLDVRYSPELMVTLEDLRRARQAGNGDAEQMARKRLKLWDVGEEQVQEFLRTGKVGTELTITSPIHGHVTKKYQREGSFVDEGTPLYDLVNLDSVWVQAQVYEADQALLKEGQAVRATTLSLPNEVFRGTLDFIYPHLDEASRTLAVRFHIPNPGHRLRPGMYATVTLAVAPGQVPALARASAAQWAADNAADVLSHALGAPTGPGARAGLAPLLRAAGRQALLDRGLVPAVPDSAVIDTGNLKVVYREASPDVFEGVAVELGPRLALAGAQTAFYPVLTGLRPGDRVVTNGSFLIDAETRLNPAAGSIYFGGSGGKGGSAGVTVRPSTPADEDATDKKVRAELVRLDAADRRLAEEQKFCPVLQKNRLGSMGPPFKVVLDGQPVLLCCESCADKARADVKKTLATVTALKQGQPPAPPPTPSPAPDAGVEAQIKANLDQLPEKDRALATEQKFCPITEARLGDPEMGVPVKVVVKDQPVFLCCKGCRKQALADPDKTLAKVKELKAKAGAGTHQREGN